jgi:2-C-methyl-D-erythritol 2,4-cyclodiphosphate synthase
MAEDRPRTGLGLDLHGFDSEPGRPLLLGGVRFEHEHGLAGHSDGDVVCHAVADALLGAAALGDLGQHFPDTDPAFEGIGGLDLLRRTVALLLHAGFRPSSCDLTILAERPHLADRRDEIRSNLAGALGVDPAEVSVKATRPEGLGLTGDGAGCLALATVLPNSNAPD